MLGILFLLSFVAWIIILSLFGMKVTVCVFLFLLLAIIHFGDFKE